MNKITDEEVSLSEFSLKRYDDGSVVHIDGKVLLQHKLTNQAYCVNFEDVSKFFNLEYDEHMDVCENLIPAEYEVQLPPSSIASQPFASQSHLSTKPIDPYKSSNAIQRQQHTFSPSTLLPYKSQTETSTSQSILHKFQLNIIQSKHLAATNYALGKAINTFAGGVILVSQVERLIKVICKELWVCGNRTVQAIEGGLDEYKREVYKEIEANS